ncbi:hypothetical protein LFYK43_13490 [Ligilactobacillus salitolerans]|uniref:Transposase n=1 Tax=Ligilactobacillus salitolerans TaxID=1808352 RepID=A0A401ITL9_9LACO|nr:hypothetical protein LFYK43_13490 [Ligilactobacillus salitolerans]
MALTQLDDELAQEKSQNLIHQKKQRTILTAFGEISYVRRYYRTPAGKENFFALDRFLGFEGRQRVTPLLKYLVAKASPGMTNRHEAEVFSLLTPVTLSHQAVNQIVHVTGAQIKAQKESEAVQAQDAIETSQLTKRRQVPYLVVTGDALLFKECGNLVRHGSLHRVTVHEGSQKLLKRDGQPVKQRKELINAKTFSGTDREAVFWQADMYLHAHYDLRETVVITNSDNGSGYTADKFERFGSGAKQWIHQLDHFHVRRKLEERLSQSHPELIQKLLRAVFRDYSWKDVELVLTTIDSQLSTDPSGNYLARAEINKLAEYLNRNWSSLEPLWWNGKLHNPGGLGTSESGHRRYSYRLKGHGKYWSAQGAEAQALIIDCDKNNNLEYYLGLPQVALKRDKWSYDGKFILKLLRQPQRLSEPHVGVTVGKVEFNGKRYMV